MYEGFKGGPRMHRAARGERRGGGGKRGKEGAQMRCARIVCIDEIRFGPEIRGVFSNADDLSKGVFRAVSPEEEVSARFNRRDNTQEIHEGG